MVFHKSITGTNVHTPVTWVVADETARLALSITSSDVNKLALQQDNNNLYILIDVTPTWVNVTETDVDVKVAIDSAATADYIGNSSGDGVLRVNNTLTYIDGGNYITLGVANEFTDADELKLDSIETGAEVNNISDANVTDLTDGLDSTLHYHASDRARGNHTGTQTASTISDFDTEVSNNTTVSTTVSDLLTHTSDTAIHFTQASISIPASQISDFDTEVANNSAVALNTAKVTNATHDGEVTGATTLTIADNVIDEDNLKLDTAPTNDYVLTADSTASGGMKWAAASGGFTDPMTTRGDLIYKNSAGTTTRLPAGTVGQVLTSDGTDIAWAAGGGGSGGAAATFERKIEGAVYTGTLMPITIPDELNGLDIKEVRLIMTGLPAGQALKVDVRKNGTATTDSIFTSDVPIEVATTQTATNGLYQSGCSIAGSTVGSPGTTLDPARDTLAQDDVLWVVVTQVGSTVAGADLSVLISVA